MSFAIVEEAYESDVGEMPSTASMLRDYRIKGISSLKKRLSYRAPPRREKQATRIVYSRFRDISSQKDPTHKMHDTVSEFIGVLAGPEKWHKKHPIGMKTAKLDRCEWMPKTAGSKTFYDDNRETIETRTMDTINTVATAGMGSFTQRFPDVADTRSLGGTCNSYAHTVPGARMPEQVGPGSYNVVMSTRRMHTKPRWRGAKLGKHLFGSGGRTDISRVSMKAGMPKEHITPGPTSDILHDDNRRWRRSRFGESRAIRPEHWVRNRHPGPAAYGKMTSEGIQGRKIRNKTEKPLEVVTGIDASDDGRKLEKSSTFVTAAPMYLRDPTDRTFGVPLHGLIATKAVMNDREDDDDMDMIDPK